jgi:hypothetical protein
MPGKSMRAIEATEKDGQIKTLHPLKLLGNHMELEVEEVRLRPKATLDHRLDTRDKDRAMLDTVVANRSKAEEILQ